jgi:hypothetical protein
VAKYAAVMAVTIIHCSSTVETGMSLEATGRMGGAFDLESNRSATQKFIHTYTKLHYEFKLVINAAP